MTYRTLSELQSELQSRLGMGAQGASGASQTLMNSFLRNGQTQLYWAQDWKHLVDYYDITTGTDQNLYDYPITGTMSADSTAARDRRVLRIETSISGQFVELKEGVTTPMWSTMDTQGSPQRYDCMRQILVYPKADTAYTLRVWFVSDLGRFTQATDRASLDDEMVLLHATANAKSHYRHPDAQVYQGQLSSLLSSLRGQSFKKDGVYRRGDAAPIERKPAVVGRDG